MRSSALAGFLASAVLVSGTAGFASTVLVGPYLGEQALHQTPKAALLASAAPMDPLAILQISVANAASLDDDEAASQTARRLRKVENTPTAETTTTTRPMAAPTHAATGGEMLGPITEEAFAQAKPPAAPVSAGGPLIATEASSAMIAAKLENGEPVLTLRIAPFVAPTMPTADLTDPDNAVEPTVISAPPSEQALATPAPAAAPTPAEADDDEDEPVAAPAPEPQAKPRKVALKPAPASDDEPTRKPAKRTARVSTTAPAAPPAPAAAIDQQPHALPTPDPLNAPYTPAATPTLGTDEPSATGAPAPMMPATSSQPEASTGGPTPLTMPQN